MSVPIGAPVVALIGAGYLSTAVGLGSNFKLIVAVIILVAGLLVNYLGMRIAGQIQVAVVLTTIIVLLLSFFASITNIKYSNFTPFMPNGWVSVGHAATILYWCFIGWEAISHLSEEFVNPQKTAIKGAVIASVIIGLLYFMTALAVVGTHSYGSNVSEASLVFIIKKTLGSNGALVTGFAALFISIAPAIAYIGAASRLAYALAKGGDVPKFLSNISKKHGTPSGGLTFLAICFVIVLVVYESGLAPLSFLLQIPNATFILTYIGGCAAGIKLLRNDKFGIAISIISLVISTIIFLFVGWAILYPLVIIVIKYFYNRFCGAKKYNFSSSFGEDAK